MKKKVRFIVNPKSGGTFGAKFSERLVKTKSGFKRNLITIFSLQNMQDMPLKLLNNH
jgi:hypothetical protein